MVAEGISRSSTTVPGRWSIAAWESDDGESESLGPCIISAPSKRFNGELLTITVPIPDSYTCTGLACWYKFKYVYTGDVNDTTTWTVYVVGNPIRIIE